jgi:DNA-binding NarL/FixJ family response regulator
MISIVIVEDQTILRDSLAAFINEQADMEVVRQLGCADDAPGAARATGCDLVLLDVYTEEGASGIEAARKIKQELPNTRCVIMTGMPEITLLDQARDAGVDSFVYKNVASSELLSVLRSTAEGYSIYPSARADDSGLSLLTDEEIEILRLVCESKSRREIAAELYLSEGTVKRRISEILATTGFDSIMKLAVHAVGTGLIVPKRHT